MKISTETLNILKLFSTINGGIKIDAGSEIFTKPETGTMVGHVKVSEEFPKTFITTDLQRFLATVSLFEEPEFEFSDEYVTISSSDGKSNTRFFYCNEALVRQPNKLPKPQPEVAISFELTKDAIQKLFKSLAVIGVNYVKVEAKEGKVIVSATEKNAVTANCFSIELCDCDPSVECVFFFKKNNLKVDTSYDYDVEISTTGLGKFVSKGSPFEELEFYIVTEQN